MSKTIPFSTISILKFFKKVRHNSIRLVCAERNNNEGLSSYNSDQQQYIIETLQKCANDNIIRPHLNEKRIKSIKSLFEQNPDIKSVESLLKINGIGPRLLDKICKSIVENPTDNSGGETRNTSATIENNKCRIPSSLITPSKIVQTDVECSVGIHIGINTISWARLWNKPNTELDTWDSLDLSGLVDKRFDIHSIWRIAVELRNRIPDADVYVMENCNWNNVTNIKKPMKYHIHDAMLTTAICSLFNQSDFGGRARGDVTNRLYYIKTYTSARLFNKLVGSERVSAQDIVENMMSGVDDKRHRPITFTANTAEQYYYLNGSQKDSLSQSLLLVVSFTELVLLQNEFALRAINPTSNKKR